MTIAPDQIETAVIALLRAIAPQLCSLGGRSEWTKVLTTQFAQLGRSKFGYYVRGVGLAYEPGAGDEPDVQRGGWLYDFAWLKYRRAGPDWELADVALAGESEWGLAQNGIDYDFEKLLASRAAHRVMVIRTPPGQENKAEAMITMLQERVAPFTRSVKEDRYLLVCVCHSTKQVVGRVYVHGVGARSV
jgi:hypothetical protein